MEELKRLVYGFGYALRGIGYAIRNERHFRIHLVALAVVITFDLMAGFSLTHWCLELLCCALVISLELVNTALERACDAVTTEKNDRIRRAKDAAAGAVLVSAVFSAVMGFLIFFGGNYGKNVRAFFRLHGWAKFALLPCAAAGLLFVFLPSHLQKRKKQ